MRCTLERLIHSALCAVAVGLFSIAVCSTSVAQNSATQRPNIVFILADDLGWTDLGCYGSRYYETPHIDELSKQGLRFTSAYSNGPNCAPTRACLMSGKYGPRTGIYTVATGARGQERYRKMVPVENRTVLPLEEVTLAEALKAAGYRTGFFGKWHLGEDAEHAPSTQGFDVAVTHGEHEHPATEFLADNAIEFIRKSAPGPFFCYLPFHAVHTPINAPPELIAKYKAKQPQGKHYNPNYAAMLEELDRNIGRVLETLDNLKIADKTLVIFTSDNGGVGGYASVGIDGAHEITHNAPLHGGKGMLYEGGIRVPLIVRWPGVIAPGSVCNEAVATIDFYPTLTEIAGAAPSAERRLDGLSLVSLWKSSGKGALPRESLYWHFPGYLEGRGDGSSWRTTPAGAIHKKNHKLIEFFETSRIELYDLDADLGETRNLADSKPEVAKQLHDELRQWRKSLNAPMPTPK